VFKKGGKKQIQLKGKAVPDIVKKLSINSHVGREKIFFVGYVNVRSMVVQLYSTSLEPGTPCSSVVHWRGDVGL
jgi:hypothetical protein